jgi:hypothetical protein
MRQHLFDGAEAGDRGDRAAAAERQSVQGRAFLRRPGVRTHDRQGDRADAGGRRAAEEGQRLPDGGLAGDAGDGEAGGPTLDDALKQEAAGGGPIVPLFVIYNLPNRDCAAEGSRGELFVDKAARPCTRPSSST